jgi:hypothetical protein
MADDKSWCSLPKVTTVTAITKLTCAPVMLPHFGIAAITVSSILTVCVNNNSRHEFFDILPT